jgi:hypothetical protein
MKIELKRSTPTSCPSLAWSHRKIPPPGSSEDNHGLRFEGILKIEFASKQLPQGQKPANSIT